MRLRTSLGNWQSVLMVVAVAAAVLLLAVPADAQCAMCRAVLKGSHDPKLMRNLNIGVLVLLIPPVTIFCSIFVILRKYRGSDG
jgi:Na+-driven multidrug efflux pump